MGNEIMLEFDAVSENEGLARVVIAAFMARLNPTLDEIDDVKTSVSEAVTNAIIHGYGENGGKVIMKAQITDDTKLIVYITDSGKGIEDIKKAREPQFTTGKDNERTGMGFYFMEAFMDNVTVESSPGNGTTVKMSKIIGNCA
jgi:stage II sporulation protein AB (anti-sigma F factor)